jgi:quinol-cytochrome oxidoreductase complex cytochrome b subunit
LRAARLIGLVVAHLLALHDVGSNNPDGVEIKATKDPKTGIPLDGIPSTRTTRARPHRRSACS